MSRILLLFEYTGLAALPFEALGAQVTTVDIKRADKYRGREVITGDVLEMEDRLVEIARECELVFGFPPCTDLAASGARHFAAKAEAEPDFQSRAVHLARSVERIGERAGRPWALENPVSSLATLWRKPDFTFHPFYYGGYLPKDDVHPLWPDIYPPRDAYMKNTCIWASEDFRMPGRVYIPVMSEDNPAWKALGGGSDRTKTIRSASPRGFFTALAKLYLGDSK